MKSLSINDIRDKIYHHYASRSIYHPPHSTKAKETKTFCSLYITNHPLSQADVLLKSEKHLQEMHERKASLLLYALAKHVARLSRVCLLSGFYYPLSKRLAI